MPIPAGEGAAAANKSLILGQFPRSVCDAMVGFRLTSKKSYDYLAERFGLKKQDVKEICKHYQQVERQTRTEKTAVPKAVQDVPEDIQKTIVHMKKVSKKSYKYLAEKYHLSEAIIQEICARSLQRPRHHTAGK